MDLLIEKDDKRTYLSRYKVITTSFEESSPSVKRNNTQIQYRNGSIDFGGWNETKTIDYVGYYRADDLEDEEHLRERIYALLSDPEGYYITQLKNNDDDSFERPGETSGDYFDKQVNRPSHKRFYVYASSLESELVGSYGGHVLYKISATFTTMKLPYGESVPRDLDVKPNVPYYGDNLLTNSNFSDESLADWVVDLGATSSFDSSGNLVLAVKGALNNRMYYSRSPLLVAGMTYAISFYAYVDSSSTSSSVNVNVGPYQNPTSISVSGNTLTRYTGILKPVSVNSSTLTIAVGKYNSGTVGDIVHITKIKLEKGSMATPWTPAPEDHGYNEWYIDTYYNTDNLVIPYAGTVPCSQLEQGFAIEFTAKQSGSNLKISLNGTDFIATGNVYSGDVFKLSGYEYLRNDISIVKATNKAYFKLLPGVANTISSSIKGTIRILGYQDLYA